MSLYRCAACGSPNVMVDTQADGVSFNYGKGIAGTLILGPGGAAAGVSSSHRQVYKCSDCGTTLSYTMEPAMKSVIDMGVISLDYRNNISIHGMKMPWETIKARYKNIESGYADQIQQKNAAFVSSVADATQEEFDAAVDTFVLALYRAGHDEHYPIPGERPACWSNENPMTLMEYYAWTNAADTIVKNFSKFIPPYTQYRKYRGLPIAMIISYAMATFIDNDILRLGCALNYVKDPVHGYDFDSYARSSDGRMLRLLVAQYAEFLYASSCSDDSERVVKVVSRTSKTRIKVDDDSVFGIDGSRIELYLPLFKVDDGVLGYWDASYGDNSPLAVHIFFTGDTNLKLKKMADNYFSYFPEKKEDFEKAIQEYKVQQEANNDIQGKIKTLTSTLAEYNNAISSNTSEIATLEKKIFGKKKAQERIAELNSMNQQFALKIQDANKEIAALKDKLVQQEDPTAFVINLIKKYDYLIAWHWSYAQEPVCEPVKESKVEAVKESPSLPDQDVANAIQKYKDLLDMGAITQEEYNAKKKQLLGL